MFHRVKSETSSQKDDTKNNDNNRIENAASGYKPSERTVENSSALQANNSTQSSAQNAPQDDDNSISAIVKSQPAIPAQSTAGQTQAQTNFSNSNKENSAMTQSASEDKNQAQKDNAKSSDYAAPAGYKATAAQRPGNYAAGSYPNFTAAQAAQRKAEEQAEKDANDAPVQRRQGTEDSRLLIGRGITMSGEIEHCDTLVVEGTVEAALKGANILDIAESGVFYGAVNIEEATISGRFEGDITVNGKLTVTSTGVVTGVISYGQLEIEGGAVIEGKISPVKAQDSQRQERTQAGREASAMARGAGSAEQREAANNGENNGGELFSRTS